MRYSTLVLALFALGCRGEWEDKEPIQNPGGYEQGITEVLPGHYEFRANKGYNCEGSTASWCRKAMLVFEAESYNENTLEDYSFTFSFTPGDTFPDFVIVFQDWVSIREEDTNGNHPITTLKLTKVNGKYYLNHYENSWQWSHEWPMTDFYDSDHMHQSDVNRGAVQVNPGTPYNVRIVIADVGFARLYVDNVKYSNAKYKTSHRYTAHTWSVGIYTSKEFTRKGDELLVEISNAKYRRNEF